MRHMRFVRNTHQGITTETYQDTVENGGVSWDQRNVLEYVEVDPNPPVPQGKGGKIAEIGYLLSWGHLSRAVVYSANKPRPNAHVMLAVQTQIRSAVCCVVVVRIL